jgi:hypothetical protein
MALVGNASAIWFTWRVGQAPSLDYISVISMNRVGGFPLWAAARNDSIQIPQQFAVRRTHVIPHCKSAGRFPPQATPSESLPNGAIQ